VIQEMRNLTFVLQAEKKSIPSFDTWYSVWQDKMKNDEILKWLHNARTTVVHIKDLETASIAEATLLTYNSYPFARIKSSVIIPNQIILNDILKKDIEKSIRAEDKELLVLNIERRWIIPEFPDQDISDILAYCFKFFNEIVANLHEYLKAPFFECSQLQQETNFNPSDLPPCMGITNEIRNVKFKLATGERLSPSSGEIKLTPEIETKLRKRYKFLKEVKPVENDEKLDIEKHAEDLMEMAKKVLQRDGHHISIVFMFDENMNGLGISEIRAFDQSEKYVLMRELAKHVKQIGAKALIVINETWIRKLKTENGKIVKPKESDINKKEALTITAINNKGGCTFLEAQFKRGVFGNIFFKKTQRLKKYEPAFLNPILEVWGLPTYSTSP
jgi:hypothetical protein